MVLSCIAMLVCAAVSAQASPAYPDALDRSSVRFTTLASPINDALIIGNGDLNALVFAAGDDIVIRVTKNDVWDARLDTSLDPPLPTLKRLLELGAGDTWEKREYILPEGNTWDGKDSYHAHPYPCPRACAVLRVPGAAKGLKDGLLNLLNGTVEINSAAGKFRVYCATDANVVVVEGGDAAKPLGAVLEAIKSDDLPASESGDTGGVKWVSQGIPGDADWAGLQFASALAQAGSRATLGVVTSREAKAVSEAAAALAAAQLARKPEDVFAAQSAAWAAYWSRSGVKLGDEVFERVWYRNLYFLRCVSKPGVVSTGLFAGLLDDKPAWHGDFHTNYNIQQTYWSAYAANQGELTEPYDRLVTEYLPRARWLAKQVFDMNGAYFPHVLFAYEPADPAACKNPNGRQYIHHVWGMTQGVNGFTVQPLWWHYLYYPDRTYLEKVAYPALRDVAEFQAAFVEQCKTKDGKAILGPTVSPEHWGWTPKFEKNMNCAFDIGMYQFVFDAARKAAETLGVDKDKVARWQAAESILPDYPVQAGLGKIVVDVQGAEPIEYNIPVPTTPVFPCDQITFRSKDSQRIQFSSTLQTIKHNGNNAPIMLAVARARMTMRDTPDWLRNELTARERPNGTLSFNRIDTGHEFNNYGHYTEMFGAVLPVNELLVQSVGGITRVFPVWPKKVDAAFSTLRTEGGFLISSSITGGKIGDTRIESTASGDIMFLSPWIHTQASADNGATWQDLGSVPPGGTVKIPTKPGMVVVLRGTPQ